MFVGWNVEQGKRFVFFRQIKKVNQLNAVCRGCTESVRFGFSFALRNGHVLLLFLRAEKSKESFLGWLQAAIYYMQGELGWLKDIFLSHVLVSCSCSVFRRGVKSTKRFAFFSKSKKQINWTQCAVDVVARIGLACSPLRGKKVIRRFVLRFDALVRPVRAWCKLYRCRFGSVCGSCGSMVGSGSCGSVRILRFINL